MSFQKRWKDRARRDLIRILNDLETRDPDWAAVVFAAIHEKIEFVCETPYLSSVFDTATRGDIRESLSGSYRIFFTVHESKRVVRIERIQHVRQQDPDFSE